MVIIDADTAERQRLAIAFTSAGFEIVEVGESVEGLLKVLDFDPDVILLAEEMPPLQAADLLVILRRVSDASVIVIGYGGDPAEVTALESGADSYFQRGRSLRLLRARVATLLRRFTSRGESRNRVPPIPISLTATERRLFTALSNHNGRPVSLEDLRLEGWAGTAGTDAVKYCLRRLRQKLQAHPCDLQLVCINGVGYRLVSTRTGLYAGNGRRLGVQPFAARGKRAGVA